MAQVDYFLKLKDIEGESTDAKHKNEIDIESWSWGETNSGSSSYGGVIASFTMRVNKSSPKLLLACASGQHIKEGLLTCRKAGKEQQEYLKIKFSDLLVSSFQTGGSAGDIVPVDQISLNFSKIEYEYYPQKEDGTLGSKVPVHWDLKQNKGG